MKNLVLYLTINYPTREKFFEILDIVEEFQIGYVEIGIPVSDPYIDGSIVRESQEKVFSTLSIKEIDSVLQEIRERYTFKVILMTYNEDSFPKRVMMPFCVLIKNCLKITSLVLFIHLRKIWIRKR